MSLITFYRHRVKITIISTSSLWLSLYDRWLTLLRSDSDDDDDESCSFQLFWSTEWLTRNSYIKTRQKKSSQRRQPSCPKCTFHCNELCHFCKGSESLSISEGLFLQINQPGLNSFTQNESIIYHAFQIDFGLLWIENTLFDHIFIILTLWPYQ